MADAPTPADAPSTLAPRPGHNADHCPCRECVALRSARATAAINARHAKEAAERYDWENTPYPDAEAHLSKLRREIEYGARVLKQRSSTAADSFVRCSACGAQIVNGRWVSAKTVQDQATGLYRTLYLCSSACMHRASINPAQHGPTTGEPTGHHPEYKRSALNPAPGEVSS